MRRTRTALTTLAVFSRIQDRAATARTAIHAFPKHGNLQGTRPRLGQGTAALNLSEEGT